MESGSSSFTVETNDRLAVEAQDNVGTVRIARAVLATIISSAALDVSGVMHMTDANTASGHHIRDRIFTGRGDEQRGVKIEIHEGKVRADLYLVVSKGENMRRVGREVQDAVSKAVRHMVGMPVEQINVHIQNVE